MIRFEKSGFFCSIWVKRMLGDIGDKEKILSRLKRTDQTPVALQIQLRF